MPANRGVFTPQIPTVFALDEWGPQSAPVCAKLPRFSALLEQKPPGFCLKAGVELPKAPFQSACKQLRCSDKAALPCTNDVLNIINEVTPPRGNGPYPAARAPASLAKGTFVRGASASVSQQTGRDRLLYLWRQLWGWETPPGSPRPQNRCQGTGDGVWGGDGSGAARRWLRRTRRKATGVVTSANPSDSSAKTTSGFNVRPGLTPTGRRRRSRAQSTTRWEEQRHRAAETGRSGQIPTVGGSPIPHCVSPISRCKAKGGLNRAEKAAKGPQSGSGH